MAGRLNRDICVAEIPGLGSPYGYVPSFAAGIAFCVVFAFSMFGHIFMAVKNRTWWQFIFVVGALGELIGWAGRTWSNKCPYQTTPFLIQICSLILAPAFFTAGIYVILGRLIVTLGRHTSPISPNMYLYIFCTVDVISLVIQAVGGGMASVAFQQDPIGNTDTGTRIMVAGVLFQLSAIVVFSFLFVWVVLKGLKSRGEVLRETKVRLVLGATVVSVAALVARAVYRTIELLQGWEGYLITTEKYFFALDGAMMVLAVVVFNFAQPGWADPWKGKIENHSNVSQGDMVQGSPYIVEGDVDRYRK
ncbi:related to RTA1 domain protein [Rhynchosporium graminicola]|uniref:Related to RTA1 domain protein n=1 Tax=Rhynchosporium graminicola TaxID=2792576 RepID=A0A1E1KFL6_9HELO|nr:related to RTA1 domain protein [Rhynchosporium commune]